ncbi:MAG: DegT/DnrJ/EryC1/StrS family aminotransferase [Candidatus Omnitrophica bacterium]|nr:DegT/DnrJ/EryC1/StrS family aminotransferase [Candidatus Omnitrophota bacterium]
MPIPLVDLTAQYRRLKPELDAAIQRVLDRGQFILGPEVEALERDVAAYCGTSQAVAVASGTDALELTLRACGIGPGDEVVTTALSFFATAQTIASVGATPVFVDIDPVTYTLDPAQVDAAISSRTKAIVPVHLYGHPADLDALLRIAQARRLAVIEDCAQAIGAALGGRRVGSFGLAGCLSFYPSKNLGAYGDGGMVVTSDAQLAERLRILRMHGSRDRIRHDVISRNSRLDELQAAILRVKLPHLEDWNAARRRHAQTYTRLLTQAGLADRLALPQARAEAGHVFHLYVVRCQDRDRVAGQLMERGIGVQSHYTIALPHEPAFASLAHRRGQFPVAEQAADTVLSLPMYPELSEEHLRTVVQSLSEVLRGFGPSKA